MQLQNLYAEIKHTSEPEGICVKVITVKQNVLFFVNFIFRIIKSVKFLVYKFQIKINIYYGLP